MQEIPLYSKDLIDLLLKTVGESIARPGDPLDSIMFHAGQRMLVMSLKHKLDKQEENILVVSSLPRELKT